MELTAKELERIIETREMIPPGVKSILELGCGDGRMLKGMEDDCTLIGLDIDIIRIKNFPGSRMIASIGRLPIRTDSSDMVLVAEVLEHLKEDTLREAALEITRAAKKYLLVTVPYKENLLKDAAKCSKCAQIYHVWGHLRKFDLGTLSSLFRDFTLIECKRLRQKETAMPSFLQLAVRKWGNVWSRTDKPCPKCGSAAIQHGGNMLGRVMERVIWRTERIPLFRRPIWVACLYKKTIMG